MKVELLAPAGSYQTVAAAIAAGADAVYMGGLKFGARAYAENGDEDTVIRAIKYAHLHGKSLYLTVNTLLKNKEMEDDLYEYLLPYYRAGLDAVIIQDPGVLLFIKKHFPDLPIHASTQMTITGEYSAELLEKMGCTRIVTARELSLHEIRDIRSRISIEIECFIHGALCYCYSGQCLMSSLLGGRSGNRGRCAQPCRLPYSVIDKGQIINSEKNQYALSPKDMCTIELLPQIIEAGVYSLKIEGRMKKPEYTAGVVRIYRKYLDLYLKDPKSYHVDKKDMQELFDLYNRDGFHTGYYLDHNGPQMMALKNSKAADGQKKRNEALFKQIREKYVEINDTIGISGCLKLHKGQPASLTVEDITVEGALVEPALKQPLNEERVRKQISKTGNTPFVFNTLKVQMDNDIFMPMQALNELRRNALACLEEHRVSAYYREQEVPYEKEEKIHAAQWRHPLWQGFSVSVDTKEQLECVLKSEYTDRIYASVSIFDRTRIDTEVYEYIKTAIKYGKKCYLALPHMVRKSQLAYVSDYFQAYCDAGLNGFLVRNLETLFLLQEKDVLKYAVIDANLYTYNHMAQSFYRSMGITEDTAPYELNAKEMSHRDNSMSEMVIYGYQPLMISAQCVKKNFAKCTGRSEILSLRDRYHKNFKVMCVCDFCYNIIYNSIPLGIFKEADLIHSLNFKGLRMSFTLEDKEEVGQLLKEFHEVYFEQKQPVLSGDRFTKGHLKRGVE